MPSPTVKHESSDVASDIRRIYALLSELKEIAPSRSATEPGHPKLGKEWYDTGASKWKKWNGITWDTL